MTISHALLLAAVENNDRRWQLLDEAIANHWPHKVLKAKSSADRINSTDYRRNLGSDERRHRTLVGKLTATTATLLDLLAQLDDDSFVETIAKSREDRADTVKLLNELDSTFEVIRKKLPAAKKAAKAAAKKLNKVVVKK